MRRGRTAVAPEKDAAGGAAPAGTWLEVLGAFLKLGLTSFGGPIAHLGYYRQELVVRRRWIDEDGYADLVALCQFLPGPASSQTGFALGLLRAGLPGALAAWAGFTLPSAVLLTAFAFGLDLIGGPAGTGAVHGLKLVAVAIVAQAVWGMARTLAPDRPRAGIAAAALILVAVVGGSPGQIGAIAGGAAAGLWWCRGNPAPPRGSLRVPVGRRTGLVALSAFFALLLLGPALARATGAQAPAMFDAFYRAGALVFGGGHVVLPLLQAEVVAPGWVDGNVFLSGYGAAQAVPGPLFTFAAYLGAVMGPAPNGLAGAALALVALFLPGLLLVLGTLPFWDGLRARPRAQAAMRGANAAVVGVLGAALYDPLWTSAVRGPGDFAMAVAGFVLLTAWRAPPWVVVGLGAAIGAARGLA